MYEEDSSSSVSTYSKNDLLKDIRQICLNVFGQQYNASRNTSKESSSLAKLNLTGDQVSSDTPSGSYSTQSAFSILLSSLSPLNSNIEEQSVTEASSLSLSSSTLLSQQVTSSSPSSASSPSLTLSPDAMAQNGSFSYTGSIEPSHLNIMDLAASLEVLCSRWSHSEFSSEVANKSSPSNFDYYSSMDYSMARIKHIKIIIFYSVILIISLIGNLFVVWVVFRQRRTRTTVNVFIGNLAFSDLMMTIVNIPINTVRFVMANWVFGGFLCSLFPFIQALVVYVSTLSMTYIAIDRYQAIVRPMKPKVASPQTVLAIIWVASAFFSIPFGIFTKIVEIPGYLVDDDPYIRCVLLYPDAAYEKPINTATFVLQFVIPLSLMIILYSQIAIKIWSKSTIGASTREQETLQSKAKKKTIVMLLLVAGVFAICWMPCNVYHLLVDFGIISRDFDTVVIVQWIAMSSVCYNPFIYCWMNKRVQNILKSLIVRIFSSKLCFLLKWTHHQPQGQLYHHNCNGQAVFDEADGMLDIEGQCEGKPQTYTNANICSPRCQLSLHEGTNSSQKFTNSDSDRRIASDCANNGAFVLSRLISQSASDYNNSRHSNANKNTCPVSRPKVYLEDIQSMTNSTLTGCNCTGRCNSSLANNAYSTGSCPITGTTNFSNSKSRDELSSASGGSASCYNGKGGSNSYLNFNGNDTLSNTSSACPGCSSNPFSLESSRRSLLRSKNCHVFRGSKQLDIHKNHLYCHKSKRVANPYCEGHSSSGSNHKTDQLSSL